MMTNDFNSKPSIQSTIAIISIMVVICLTVIAIKPGLVLTILKPTPIAIQPTSSLSNGYLPEIVPVLTHTPDLVQAAMVLPTDTPAPTFTPTVTPTYSFITQPLPDLTVTGISDPICRPDYPGTIIEFNIYVRNIGRARTRSFGAFDTDVFLILGQRRYSLDEWAEQFDGVVGSSVTEVYNLNPNDDIKFTVVIDIKGNKSFGVEVTANSGENPIPEVDRINNTLIKYYSTYCY